jgi:hypothetical protein
MVAVPPSQSQARSLGEIARAEIAVRPLVSSRLILRYYQPSASDGTWMM